MQQQRHDTVAHGLCALCSSRLRKNPQPGSRLKARGKDGFSTVKSLLPTALSLQPTAKMAFVSILLGSALSFGCATSYQAKGFQGGYADEQIEHDSFWVSFHGNVPSLDPAALEQGLLHRAAEVTLKHGFTHFVVLSHRDERSVKLEVTLKGVGPSAQTGRAIMIRCFYSALNQPEAIDAARVLQRPSPKASSASGIAQQTHAL